MHFLSSFAPGDSNTPPTPQQPAQVCVCISGRGGDRKKGRGVVSKQVVIAGNGGGNSPQFITDYLCFSVFGQETKGEQVAVYH